MSMLTGPQCPHMAENEASKEPSGDESFSCGRFSSARIRAKTVHSTDLPNVRYVLPKKKTVF